MKTKVEIVLAGCDDSTRMIMEVTDAELAFLERLAKESEKVSEYLCMPVLEFDKIEDKEEE